MKKLSLLLVVGLFLLAFACGGGGDDPKSVMKDYFNVMDDFYSSVEKAENADDIVAAIDNFSKGIQELAPRMKKVQEQYPELNMKNGKIPEEFKEFEEKINEIGPKMMGLMGKFAKYANDPKVQAAQQKMMEAMKALQ
ncbi:MAG: hypothetical protein PVH61_38590 [Candidatus Aminicenantes bacterium]|jgi:hypothetical protein